MPLRVDLASVWIHPKTHKRLSEAKAKAYNKRAKKPIKPIPYLITRYTVGEPSSYTHPRYYQVDKKRAGRIKYMARLTRVEKVMKATSFADRKVRDTLGRHRVFKTLWDDFITEGDIQRRGAVRITVNGFLDGKRKKEIIHLPFHRQIWMEGFSSEQRAYEGFKDWLVAAVLSNLRRRGLRLSNTHESNKRATQLKKDRDAEIQLLEFQEDAQKRAGTMERIAWKTKAIGVQKKLKQMTGGIIRIEKLV